MAMAEPAISPIRSAASPSSAQSCTTPPCKRSNVSETSLHANDHYLELAAIVARFYRRRSMSGGSAGSAGMSCPSSTAGRSRSPPPTDTRALAKSSVGQMNPEGISPCRAQVLSDVVRIGCQRKRLQFPRENRLSFNRPFLG